MSYLRYVEHSAENLQFFLWWKDYVKRFNQISASELALAPEWTQAMEEDVIVRIKKEHTENARKLAKSDIAAELLKGTDFEKSGETTKPSIPDASNPFATPLGSHDEIDLHSDIYNTSALPYNARAARAFDSAGLKAPCRSLPLLPSTRCSKLTNI